MQAEAVDTALNPRVLAVKPAKTMVLADLASSMREQGVDVVKLAAGEPDFDTPEAVINAGVEALKYANFPCGNTPHYALPQYNHCFLEAVHTGLQMSFPPC